MRVAVWHNLPSGGGKRALWHQVRGLVARGHHVEAWCPPTADRTFLPLSELGVREHVVPAPVVDRSLPTPVRWWNVVRTVTSRAEGRERHAGACAAQMAAGGFDVLLAGSCVESAAGPIGRYFTGPSVLYLQEPNRRLAEARPTPPWMAGDPPPRDRFRRRWLKVVLSEAASNHANRLLLRHEYLNAKAFGRILVNSQFSRESVLRQYGLECRVCYLGIDATAFRPTECGPGLGDYVVGLGAFHFGKGIERAIEALSLIDSSKRPRLIWVGNDAHLRQDQFYQTYAAERGVTFVPRVRVTDAELVGLLGGAAAMLYTPRLEPFGFAPLEAGACGVPVAAIAEGGVRETVVHDVTGLLVPDANPAALAVAVERLLTDPALRGRLGRAAREAVMANWTWDRSVDQLERELTAAADAGVPECMPAENGLPTRSDTKPHRAGRT